jgi:hypothetical protein
MPWIIIPLCEKPFSWAFLRFEELIYKSIRVIGFSIAFSQVKSMKFFLGRKQEFGIPGTFGGKLFLLKLI